MSIFSNAELEIINKARLPKEARPSYYSSAQRDFVQIDENFEGYLILQDKEQKQKGLTWIKTAGDFEVQNKDHDELLAEYLTIRREDAEARMEDLDAKLNEYIEFQAGVLTDSEGTDPSRFATINEVNVMIRSLSRSIHRIKILREASFHEQTMVNLLEKSLESEETNEETQKELSSWQTVMSTYKGQDSKSGSSSDLGSSILGI
jgi:hypothetical protein